MVLELVILGLLLFLSGTLNNELLTNLIIMLMIIIIMMMVELFHEKPAVPLWMHVVGMRHVHCMLS
jgi:hypothetical protein